MFFIWIPLILPIAAPRRALLAFYLLPHLYALGGEGAAVVFDEEMAVL